MLSIALFQSSGIFLSFATSTLLTTLIVAPFLTFGERVNKPKFILADEPTGNLDSKNTNFLLELIKIFRDKYNIAFIIATHDVKVTKICDRILKLKNGKLHYMNRND